MEWFRERRDLIVLNNIREAFKNQYYGSIEIWRLLGANINLKYWEKSTFKKIKKAPIVYCIYYFFFSDFIRFFKYRNLHSKILIDNNALFVEALSDDARISGFWLPILKNSEIGKAVIVTEKIEIYNKYSPLYSVLLLKSFSFLEWIKGRIFIVLFLVKNYKFLFLNKKEFHPISAIDLLNIIIIQINCATKFKWAVNKYKPKGFLTVWDWYDLGSVGTAVFKSKGLPTFTFIHGAAGKESLKEFVPLNADYVISWGNHNTKSLLEYGIRENRILQCGCTKMKSFRQYQSQEEIIGKFILLIILTAIIDPLFVDDIILISTTFGSTIELNVRLHPSTNIGDLDEKLLSLKINFIIPDEETIEKSISDSSIVIVDTSTAGFDAVNMDKPVFVIDSAPNRRNQDIMDEVLFYGAAVFCRSFQEFEANFQKYKNDSEFRNHLSRNRIRFVDDFISDYDEIAAVKIIDSINIITKKV